MCGVFGFIGRKGKGPDLRRLRKLAQVTEERGPDAFGFAWVDQAGRLKMFKAAGRITDHLGLLAMVKDARMVIGHCRFATQGDPAHNSNNHPHSADGGWIVHNGVLHNYRGIVEDHDLTPVTACDSEVLGLLIERLDGDLVDRCVGAAQATERGGLVMMGLWSRPARMVIVKRGNPLMIGTTTRGVYLASLEEGLPKNRRHVADNSVTDCMKGKIHVEQIKDIARQVTLRGRTAPLWG